MKKILETFKSLYTCEDSGKTHLTLALMFLLPSLLGASIQFLDKDFAEFQTSVIIMALIFAALSIIPILFLIGYYLRFVNQRLSGEKGIPTIDWGSVTRGAKAIPLYLVWALYVAIPFLVYFFILVAVFGGLFLVGGANTLSLILSFFILMVGAFLALIPVFIITPFIMEVYFMYCENFEYHKTLFNPLLPFKFMKKAFKDSMLVALKYLAVSLVVNTAFQFIIGLLFLIIILFGAGIVIFLKASAFDSSPLFISLVILISGLFGMFSAYASQIVGFAYSDNLIEVYKEKIMSTNEELVSETQNEISEAE